MSIESFLFVLTGGVVLCALYALTFGLSAAMAGIAGYFVGSIRFINPTVGADPLMKALIVVIFGGIARFTSPIHAALMTIVLTIKLSGLFGTHQRTF
ncbi:hypothetical protein [Aestuariivita sp.]|jgi:branched-chain amino acid transport system permease protein|uniref:hypothetical protein n=1 Tax=Aestuariivita sp. TaxID=1872407 RepID=UPI00216E325D|nr:hypothetical protein [Aestuariivita sp.]MCE8006157.1 hypothetical protein [Aestuariivita sp.]